MYHRRLGRGCLLDVQSKLQALKDTGATDSKETLGKEAQRDPRTCYRTLEATTCSHHPKQIDNGT